MVHAFSPFGFSLTHDEKEIHFLTDARTGQPILNAEDFYDAMRKATERYFRQLRENRDLRASFVARLKDKRYGGPIGIGPLRPE